MNKFDTIVIGSGPTGASAASELIRQGRSVLMLDWGADDQHTRSNIPEGPFSEIRSSSEAARNVLIGQNLEGVPLGRTKVGAQLTPPRQYVHRDADRLLKYEHDGFTPLQSLALGGLGAAWGTACFTYTPEELRRIGMAGRISNETYSAVASDIGVSAPRASAETALWWSGVEEHQPALDIDDNAKTILAQYGKNRARHTERGFLLGRIPLAVLSVDRGSRRSNPYWDMDFYGDGLGSAYRPRYTIEELKKNPLFTYRAGVLVTSVSEASGVAQAHAVCDEGRVTFRGTAIILCAGAIGSARIALNSVPAGVNGTSLLCNPYRYVPSVNLSMFGRSAGDRRHSLAQLTAVAGDPHDPAAQCSVQLYSYRSLLLFHLVKEMPLPAWAGCLVSRALVNSLVIFGAFFSDDQTVAKTVRLMESASGEIPKLTFAYRRTAEEEAERTKAEKTLLRSMTALRCIPLGVINPGSAGSIHYAGTIPRKNRVNPAFHTDDLDRLCTFSRIFVGDASSWNWLPSKGMTFTAMAGARSVARRVCEMLAYSS